MGRVFLKPGKEKKILNFYPNVYEDDILSFPGEREDGVLTEICDHEGTFLAKGYVSVGSSAVVRVLTLSEEKIDGEFFRKKIENAFGRRKELLKETNCLRAFYAEADGIPGLIIDWFDGHLSLQFRNGGIEAFRKEILRAAQKVFKAKGIYEKSDLEIRNREGAGGKEGLLSGEIPPRILMEDQGVRYAVDIIQGQKTGFFLDQRDSRRFIRNYITERTAFLDVFSSAGGFSMAALKEGARKVVAIDKDPYALALAGENRELNGAGGEFVTLEGDALQLLENLGRKKEKYDIITLDPPALVKKKADVPKGRDLFYDLCEASFRLLDKGGILGVMSCAYYITLQDLLEVTRMAASKHQKLLEVIGINYQPKDHPWVLHIPETLYLKALWVRII
ncbi:MAG: class I SAM-dependent rRNA methyltransferase [Fusobacteriaceae bacterium]|nr:class I SAM-dependent rRNA methyltransferase [Fusobacteriaceae bacterium]